MEKDLTVLLSMKQGDVNVDFMAVEKERLITVSTRGVLNINKDFLGILIIYWTQQVLLFVEVIKNITMNKCN